MNQKKKPVYRFGTCTYRHNNKVTVHCPICSKEINIQDGHLTVDKTNERGRYCVIEYICSELCFNTYVLQHLDEE